MMTMISKRWVEAGRLRGMRLRGNHRVAGLLVAAIATASVEGQGFGMSFRPKLSAEDMQEMYGSVGGDIMGKRQVEEQPELQGQMQVQMQQGEQQQGLQAVQDAMPGMEGRMFGHQALEQEGLGVGGLRGFYGGGAGGDSGPSMMGVNGLMATGIPGGGLGVNGLPIINPDQAMAEFMKNAQQYVSDGSQGVDGGEYAGMDADQAMAEGDLEEEAEDEHGNHGASAAKTKKTTFIHKAVPKLQKWLAAMDPMQYSAPTFSNPVATQYFSRLADKTTPPAERIRMQRLASSPYMFNQLGNPAYADPQLWSGLVSGAAVPYPMRTLVMAQRTMLPHTMASTGQSMSGMDQIGMAAYNQQIKKSTGTVASDNGQGRRQAHKAFKLLAALRDRSRRSMQPTPHGDEH